MELRDKFAETALIHALKAGGSPTDLAKFAYDVADAMIEAREGHTSISLEVEEPAADEVVEEVVSAQFEPMPELPKFDVPEHVETKCPITNVAEMVKFLIGKYKEIGQERGAGIQPILVKYGYSNANEIKEKDLSAIYNELNAL